jgi:hypothetical protein
VLGDGPDAILSDGDERFHWSASRALGAEKGMGIHVRTSPVGLGCKRFGAEAPIPIASAALASPASTGWAIHYVEIQLDFDDLHFNLSFTEWAWLVPDPDVREHVLVELFAAARALVAVDVWHNCSFPVGEVIETIYCSSVQWSIQIFRV